MRTYQVGLYDFVTKKRIETIDIIPKDGQNLSSACVDWSKKAYEGKAYKEFHDHPTNEEKEIVQIFNEESDFFLMYSKNRKIEA